MEPKPTYNSATAHDPERAVIVRRPLRSGEAGARRPRAWDSLRRWLIPHTGPLEPDESISGASARTRLRGYGAAVAGIAAVSLVIAAIPHHATLQGIFLLYLFVVMWLAVAFGRGPAVAASIFAFLAYDFFFIPPLYVLTVGHSEEWISLFALLATSLVISQLTAALQARTREAEASQRRTAALYALARLVVETSDQEQLYRDLVRRTVAEFAAQGVAACVLLVPDESQGQVMVAAAPEGSPLLATLDLGLRENAGKVAWVFEHASPVGGALTAAKADSTELVRYYLPLMSGRQVIGALGVAGSPALRRLARETTAKAPEHAAQPADSADTTPQVALFRAFRDQIALVLERSSLQERAIHNEALQESDRLKNALLGSVTHDLRTPLASIKAAATSLLQPGVEWTASDRNELLTFIDMSADRLNRLVSNLLDLSRLEAGGAKPIKEWHLINDVIATVLDRLELTGATRDHRITVVAPQDLPLVPFDYAQIEQVLTNLIENALKYSPGGSEIRIEASAHEDAQLEVRVSDQGIGIPAGELESIFDKFYRIQHVRLPWQTERPPLGTGLGLAICRSIITAHGGRIWAESREGEGATFIFTLPIPTNRPQGKLPDLGRADVTPIPTPTPPAQREAPV